MFSFCGDKSFYISTLTKQVIFKDFFIRLKPKIPGGKVK
jgi:hypothetical protein